ncbi:EF-hand domain-containing protein [Fulvimonas yonginensis]|uniref:EF-hand domain-containing protein n=1 Tax=Fulvimonas yonginensis TaxID=1495200 RepID=A0ABU8JBR6_9GAMM
MVANRQGRILGSALAALGALCLCGVAVAQEKAQKGVSAGALERRSQHTGSQDPLSIERRLRERDAARPRMSDQQLTDLFLALDRNRDLRLARSEVASLPVLRARFDTFDLNGNHRLDYSEFADYADTAANELAQHGP